MIRQAEHNATLTATFKAAGASVPDLVSVQESLAAFDEALCSPPEKVSSQQQLLRELGLV